MMAWPVDCIGVSNRWHCVDDTWYFVQPDRSRTIPQHAKRAQQPAQKVCVASKSLAGHVKRQRQVSRFQTGQVSANGSRDQEFTPKWCYFLKHDWWLFLGYFWIIFSYQNATDDDLKAYNDNCAICREPMAHAKKLPCGHLFHL